MPEQQEPIRTAIVGTGSRSSYMYGPILKALEEVELVSVWGRSADSSRQLGESLSVPWYTDLERLIRETEPQIGVVCVNYSANGQVALMAVEHGLHIVTETPIAHKLSKLARRWYAGASPRHPQRRARFRGWGFHPTLGRGCSHPPAPPGPDPAPRGGASPCREAATKAK